MRTLVLTLVLATAALAAAAFALTREPSADTSGLSLADAMRSDTTGYALALEPRPFVFPDDHGPHPDFRTEWWYLTGNLAAVDPDAPEPAIPLLDQPFPDGRAFGFEWTLFRIAATPPTADTTGFSDWNTRQFYMGHFAMTDVQAERFHAFERFSRSAQGLAGAQADPFRVHLDDWALQSGPDGLPQMRLYARQEASAIDLILELAKPMVLQGDRGLSQKGREAGNASFYYSYTRLHARGHVETPDAGRVPVRGQVWMDREWSTSALDEDQVGWDWFALQLSDGRDLMVYNLRERGGGASRFSKGTLVGRDGSKTPLGVDDYSIEPTRTWTSPHSDATYPVAWRVRVPGQGLDLRVESVMDDQELNVSVRYWEGSVRVSSWGGAEGGSGLTGVGYVELTGYDPASQGGARAQIASEAAE
jgi:predicted secreted hydrolase